MDKQSNRILMDVINFSLIKELIIIILLSCVLLLLLFFHQGPIQTSFAELGTPY